MTPTRSLRDEHDRRLAGLADHSYLATNPITSVEAASLSKALVSRCACSDRVVECHRTRTASDLSLLEGGSGTFGALLARRMRGGGSATTTRSANRPIGMTPGDRAPRWV